jgi:signal peptidase I
VTEREPPNPYAPSAALADDAAATDAAAPVARARKPSRLGAVALTLLAHPFSGAGFYVLGRRRLCAGWTAAGLAATVLMVAGVRTNHPLLYLVGFVALIASALWSFLGAIIARPGDAPPVGRAWLFAIAIVIASRSGGVAIRTWLSEAFQIPSGAMIPTLLVGDHIFVKKGRSDIARGDVIAFKFPMDTNTDYVKRVVAVGGDTIQVRDGVPAINGIPLDHQAIAEPCTHQPDPGESEPCTLVRETNAGRSYIVMFGSRGRAPDFQSIVVPDGEVFVMGDNRDNSYDSRRWGTVKVDLIKGKTMFVWWSKDPTAGVRWSRVGHRVD